MAAASQPSRLKLFVFYIVLFSLPFALLAVLVLGYYAYRKFEENIVYSEPFGQIDDRIGWVLRPGADSRISHKNRLTGEIYYDIRVRTGREGFRAAFANDSAVPSTVAAVGDSWTFGTAVDYAHSYPAQLAAKLRVPVANLGVPAHGVAQTILLLERHVEALRPKAVVHVNLGLWARSVCHGEAQPDNLLKPCFWKNPSGITELVVPAAGHVTAMAARGVYPGGWLTAGHNTWTYYLVSRPAVRIMQFLASTGIVSGQTAEDDPSTARREDVVTAALERFLALARRHDFRFVLFDPSGDYSAAVARLAPSDAERLIYLGQAVQRGEIAPRAAQIPPERQRVPRDGHFTGEYMALWVEMLAPRIAPLVAAN